MTEGKKRLSIEIDLDAYVFVLKYLKDDNEGKSQYTDEEKLIAYRKLLQALFELAH